jgi:hypothetical protein
MIIFRITPVIPGRLSWSFSSGGCMWIHCTGSGNHPAFHHARFSSFLFSFEASAGHGSAAGDSVPRESGSLCTSTSSSILP